MNIAAQKATRLSKFLRKYLRHQPAALGIELQEGGWVNVEALLAARAAHGGPIGQPQLAELVAGSDKQRFAFDAAAGRIRAQQGYRVEVACSSCPASPRWCCTTALRRPHYPPFGVKACKSRVIAPNA